MPSFLRIVFALIIVLTIRSLASAQLPNENARGKIDDATVAWSKKRVAFEMRGKPWAQVFEWFSDQTGMPFASTYPPPTGTFNFINPKDPGTGKSREYALTEVFDTINEFLQAQHKFLLLRTDTVLTMVPADEPIPQKLISRISVDELTRRGRTEIVEIVVHLKPSTSKDDWLRKNGFGVPLRLIGDNTYALQADVKSIRQFLAALDQESLPAITPPAPKHILRTPPVAACCGSAPHCRPGLLARVFRR